MDRRSDAEKGTKVFVGNIPPDTESSDLRDFFRDYGLINDAWVARKPPGFGFVFFDSDRDARDAVRDLSGRDLRGNRVRVELSKPRGVSPPRKSYGSRDGRDERSPPRRSSGNGRGRSRSPSPRGGGGGGGRSPRARSPFKEREKREERDAGSDRADRSERTERSERSERSPRRSSADEGLHRRKADDDAAPLRRRSRSRDRNHEASRERSRS